MKINVRILSITKYLIKDNTVSVRLLKELSKVQTELHNKSFIHMHIQKIFSYANYPVMKSIFCFCNFVRYFFVSLAIVAREPGSRKCNFQQMGSSIKPPNKMKIFK